LRDYALFLQQFRCNFTTTGSVFPSGKPLARALTSPLREFHGSSPKDHAPIHVLECGPGTGAVTTEIVPLLGPNDQLTLVEANPVFAKRVEERFAQEALFHDVSKRSRILCQRLEDVQEQSAFDFVISGLPLANFPLDDVQAILEQFERVTRPGGHISFFEYVAVRPARTLITGGKDRARLAGIKSLLVDMFGRHPSRREIVLANFPPAWAQHVHFRGNR